MTNNWLEQAQKETTEKMKPIIKEKIVEAIDKAVKEKELIDPNDYDVVICVKGKGGRFFENGIDRSENLARVKLEHEAGSRATLKTTRRV